LDLPTEQKQFELHDEVKSLAIEGQEKIEKEE
jgi:hypothetical protein